MMATIKVAFSGLALFLALIPQTQRLFAQKYVTVLGSDGRPVAGLQSEDFSLRDGDIRRPMQGVEAATTPLAIEIAIDGFGEGDSAILDRLTQQARDMQSKSSARAHFGVVRVKGPSAMHTLLDACAAIDAAPSDRRAVIALIRQTADDPAITEPYKLTDALKDVRASLWAIVLVDDKKSLSSSLDSALTSAAQISGGMREVVTSTAAVGETLSRVLQLLSSQYLVTFLWPDPMLSQLNIVTRHDSGTVLAPLWNR
jgi:hypothetical protein